MNKTEITDKVEKDLLNYFGAKTLLSNNKKLMEICIESTLKAINYSQCCESDSELLSCKCGLPKGKQGIAFSCMRTDCDANTTT